MRSAERVGRVWEGSGVPPGGPGELGVPTGGVGRLFQRAGSCQEALTEGQEVWGGPPGGLGRVGRLSRKTGSGQEALLESLEGLEEIGSTTRRVRRIGRPPRRAGRNGRPSRRAGKVVRPSRSAGRGQEAILEGRKGLGGPLGGPEVFGRTSWRACRGWEALPEGW